MASVPACCCLYYHNTPCGAQHACWPASNVCGCVVQCPLTSTSLLPPPRLVPLACAQLCCPHRPCPCPLSPAGDLHSSSSATSYLDAEFEEDAAGGNSVHGACCTTEMIEAALTKAFHITGELRRCNPVSSGLPASLPACWVCTAGFMPCSRLMLPLALPAQQLAPAVPAP